MDNKSDIDIPDAILLEAHISLPSIVVVPDPSLLTTQSKNVTVQSLSICTLVSPSFEQGTSLSHSRIGAEVEAVNRLFQSRVVSNWLNVILDMNGILCVS